jgi:hypothetical protein
MVGWTNLGVVPTNFALCLSLQCPCHFISFKIYSNGLGLRI